MDIALSQGSPSMDISGANVRGSFRAKSNLLLLDVRVFPFSCLKTKKDFKEAILFLGVETPYLHYHKEQDSYLSSSPLR